MKPIVRVIFFLALSASVLSAQSLVELAKKEKARREGLKAKSARVITNADLASGLRAPALEIPSGPETDGTAGRGGEEEALPGAAGEAAQPYPRARFGPGGGEPDSGGFARAAMEETALVENPEFALQYPDGRFAEISFRGSLELDFIARNGPGDDIAIFARRSGTRDGAEIEEGMPASVSETSAFPGALFYGVLVLTDRGEWRELGTGVGLMSPERFDLGDISKIMAIKILFVPLGNASQESKDWSLAPVSFTMGVDAVQALH
jgi:hypothetical protein